MNDAYELPLAKNMLKAVELAKQIYDYKQSSRDYPSFVNNRKADSKDSSHRLRLIHDQFLQDSFSNYCIGTIYRTEKAREEINKIHTLKGDYPELYKEDKGWGVHCEHVIPNNLLSKYLFFQLQNEEDNSQQLFYNFVYYNRVICAIHNSEKEELNRPRKIGDKNSSWSSSHPAFESKSGYIKCTLEDVKPFERYIGTDLKVYCILTNEEICFTNFTMKDHYKIISEHQFEILNLYNKALKEKYDIAI